MEKAITPYVLMAAALLPAAAMAQKSDNDSVQALEEIVVTGSNKAVEARLLPYTVTVVDRAELESSGSPQLLTALKGRVPSLFVTERGIFGYGVAGNGAGHIKMRGVGGDRASAVLMMMDGQPQFAGIYSHHIGDFYSKEYVERVEVLRGPASVLYGSNAMAGTINVITRGAHADGVHADLTTQYGSYNTWQTSLTGTARYGRLSSLVSLSYDRTDGNVDGFDFKQGGGYAKVAYDFSDRWKAQADYTVMKFNADDPIYPTLSDPSSTAVYTQNVLRGEASAAVTNSYANTGGTVRVYYSYGNHYVDDPRHFHSVDDRFGVMAYQNFAPWKGAAITAGFDFSRYSGKIPMSGGTAHTPGAMGTISRKYVTEYSPYVTAAQAFFDRVLTVSAGLRMANSDMFGTRWVPQAGVAVNTPGDITVKASAAMGYRNPSFRELYLYRMANPDLHPERMWNYEVAVEKRFSHLLSVELTAYYSRGSDMIQTVDMKNVNIGAFINKGIEVSVASRPIQRLGLRATYSYLHTSLSNLTGAPVNQYWLGADWQALPRLNLCAELQGVGGLYVTDGMHRQNYALVNLKATYRVWRHAEIFTRLENITDARYTINRGYPMPGFTAMGGVRVGF